MKEKIKIAIDVMEFFKKVLYNGIYRRYVGNFDIAINSLEKQIPKKPQKIISNKIGVGYNCPNCDKTFVRIDKNNVQWGHISKFCENCGQALDWGDTE